jgi:hypothetical protein
VLGNLPGRARMRAIRELRGTDRLAAASASLSGQPTALSAQPVIPVVQGWVRAMANAGILGGLRARPVIVVAPPIAAALAVLAVRLGRLGQVADPQGELAAFWQQMNPFGQLGLQVYPDSEQAGSLGGDLQCEQDVACAWADDSGIVVVSLSSAQNASAAVVVTTGATLDKSQWAALTLRLCNVAEVRASTTKPQATATAAQPAITPNPVQGP